MKNRRLLIRFLLSSGWLVVICLAGFFVFRQFQGQLVFHDIHWKLASMGLALGLFSSLPITYLIYDYLIPPSNPNRASISFILTFLPSIAKYIPGKIWTVAGFLYQAEKLSGISKKDASFFQIYMQLNGVISSSILSLIGLFFAKFLFDDPGFLIYLFWGALLLLIICVIGIFLFYKASKKLRHRVSLKKMPHHILAFSIQKIFKGVSLYLFICAFSPIFDYLFEIVFAFVISMQLGLLAFFAPAGIGITEGAYMFLLSGVLSPATALNIALIARVWHTIIDFVMALTAFILKLLIARSKATFPHTPKLAEPD
jgi:hypothetical protein